MIDCNITKQPYIEKILALSKPRKPIKSDRQGIRYVTTYECPNCLKEILGNEEYRNLIDRETAYKQRIEERRKKKERDTD
nr:hypothetical protein [uncultured Ruminococcus sp.]